MSKKFDYLVFIGRFQPIHNGHMQVIQTALSLANKVILVMGSANLPRTPKNPFTYSERVGMLIRQDLGAVHQRITTVPVKDSMYNDQKWATDVQFAVETQLKSGWQDREPKIGIIGHHKDDSSFYLDMFPQWEQVEHRMDEAVSATDLRDLYFDGKNLKFLQSLVPPAVFDWLESFRKTKEYEQVVKEYEFLKNYKKSWAGAPYVPTFVTVDAVVVQSAHVLLVQRAAGAYGGGLWALPGGFLNPKEWIVDAAIRELREETRLKVPAPVLKGSIKASKVFDGPNRSLRGRTVTHAFHIELPAGPLPKVKGSDDAQDARWFPTNKIKWSTLFEDHGDIIAYFLGI